MLELFRIYGTIELKGADKTSKDLDRVDGKAKGIVGGIKDFAKGVGKIAAGIGVFALVGKAIDTVKQSLDGAIDRYDTLNNFPRVMQQLGFDANESDKAIKRLSDGIQGLPTRLDEVAKTAQNIAILTNDLDKATETTLALNNAFLASGASTADAARGLEQYVQMLAKGEVDLQSWRTLQETMGLALNQLAKDFGFTGKSAQNDLYEALKSGKITFEEFNDALIEASNRTGGFAEMALTSSGGIKTAMTNLKTWVVMGVADVIGAFDEVLGGTGSIEQGILKLKPIVQGIFGWIANTAIPAVANGVQWLSDKFNDLKPVFEQVKGALEPLFAVFRQTTDNLRSQLGPYLQTVIETLKSFLPILKAVGSVVGTSLLVMFIAFTSVLNAVYNAIIPIVTALWNLIDVSTNVVNIVVALIRGDFAGAFEHLKQAASSAVELFENLFGGIIGFVKGLVDGIVGWFKTLYNILVGNSIIPDMINAIIDWFKNLFKWAIDIVKNFVKGIVQYFQNLYNRISSVMTTIRSIITTILNYVRNTFKNALQFLKGLVTVDFGMMRQAVQNQMNNIRNTIRNIVNALPNVFKKGLSKVRSVLSSGMSNALKVVTGFASKFVQAGQNLVNSIASGIRNAIGNVTSAISSVTSKIRNFLPFSPAKEGPLMDLDKLDFAGPIGDSILKAERILKSKMNEMLGNIHPSANLSVDVGKRVASSNGSNRTGNSIITKVGDIIINATVRNDSDIDKLTRKIDETLNNLGNRRAAAFGG